MRRNATTSVAHVLWSGRVGGIERLVRDLAAEQIEHGVRVTVAFGQASGPFVRAVADAGADVVDLGLASGHDLGPRRIERAARRLRMSEVVHAHGFNPALFAIIRRANRPVVFTEHGNFGLGRPLRTRDRLKRRLQRRFLRAHAGAVAANSKHTAERLCHIYGIPSRAVTVVYNGVTLDETDAGPRDQQEKLRIAFIGRLAGMKRVDRLVLGFAQARKREAMHLVIVGEGPERADILQLCRVNGLEPQLSFLGLRSDVHSILRSIDVFVLPSEAEPFGLVILEACAAGALPIVFRDAGGALEALPPDGLIVDDVAGLAAALDGIIGSTALAPAARNRRLDWVRREFPISSTAQAYEALYRVAASRG